MTSFGSCTAAEESGQPKEVKVQAGSNRNKRYRGCEKRAGAKVKKAIQTSYGCGQKTHTGARVEKSSGNMTTALRDTVLPRALSSDKDLKAVFLVKKAEQMGITIFEEMEPFS